FAGEPKSGDPRTGELREDPGAVGFLLPQDHRRSPEGDSVGVGPENLPGDLACLVGIVRRGNETDRAVRRERQPRARASEPREPVALRGGDGDGRRVLPRTEDGLEKLASSFREV